MCNISLKSLESYPYPPSYGGAGGYSLGSLGSHGRKSDCPRTPRWNLRAKKDAMQLSMKDKSYMLKKGGHVRHHLTVAGVISLLTVLCVSSAESRAQTPPPTPVLTEQEAVAIAKTANRQTKKASLDIDRAANSTWA